MAALPVRDSAGNALTGFSFVAEEQLAHLAARVAMPASLVVVTYAHAVLIKPERHELLAVYQVRLQVMPELTVNDEALDFRWWPPSEPVSEDMSPLDAEIARRVVRSSLT